MNTINMLTDAPVMFAAVYVSPIVVTDSQEAFRELTRCAERYALEFTGVLPGEIPGVQEARQFFRAIGIDPTKRRLSSEALLLRSIKRKGIDPVNNLVDVGNWCSLEFLL
ncbi:MAG: hypothetical protein EHM72_17940, partial [Calditrichaeota bacterium]